MIEAGLRGTGDLAARYIAETCLLADEQNTVPSLVHQWSRRDRVLMLSYFNVKHKLIKEAIDKNKPKGR